MARRVINFPWILERIKSENPDKSDSEIQKLYVSYVKSQALPNLIEKFGPEEGKRRYEARNKNVGKGHSLYGYIEKYGKEKGEELYYSSLNKRRFSITLEGFIQNHGLEKGTEMYNNRNKILMKDLNTLIELYGPEEGKRKYDERCKKISHSSTLEGFKERYGDEEGEAKFLSHAERSSHTFNNFISRYGENEGTKKWNEYLMKLSNRTNEKCSKISLELFDFIKSRLIDLGYNESDIFYGKRERSFFIDLLNSDKKVTVKPDFYLESNKKVIEFYGDYWHHNPWSLSESDDGESHSKIWEWDELRIKSMYRSEYVDSVMVVWEKDYKENKQQVVEQLIKFLTDGKN